MGRAPRNGCGGQGGTQERGLTCMEVQYPRAVARYKWASTAQSTHKDTNPVGSGVIG
jgi:hypothetical protein